MGLGEVRHLSMKTHLCTVAGHEKGRRRSLTSPKFLLSVGQVFGAEVERWAGRGGPH